MSCDVESTGDLPLDLSSFTPILQQILSNISNTETSWYCNQELCNSLVYLFRVNVHVNSSNKIWLQHYHHIEQCNIPNILIYIRVNFVFMHLLSISLNMEHLMLLQYQKTLLEYSENLIKSHLVGFFGLKDKNGLHAYLATSFENIEQMFVSNVIAKYAFYIIQPLKEGLFGYRQQIYLCRSSFSMEIQAHSLDITRN